MFATGGPGRLPWIHFLHKCIDSLRANSLLSVRPWEKQSRRVFSSRSSILLGMKRASACSNNKPHPTVLPVRASQRCTHGSVCFRTLADCWISQWGKLQLKATAPHCLFQFFFFLHNQLQIKHGARVNNVASHSNPADDGCAGFWKSRAHAAVASALVFLSCHQVEASVVFCGRVSGTTSDSLWHFWPFFF